MKTLITTFLILFSSVSLSEGSVYYCVGEKKYIHYSPNVPKEITDGTLKPNKHSIKIDLQNKTIENDRLVLWDSNKDGIKLEGEIQTIDCNNYRGVLRCVTSLGRIFSFDPKTNEYVSIQISDGSNDDFFEDRFVYSEFGKCEKFE